MTMEQRKLTLKNLSGIEQLRLKELGEIGRSIEGKRGLELLTSLKREALDHGPYAGVTLFEAANRIMSDLVILKGVHFLLTEEIFPFDAYTVEFGNEDCNGFDIRANKGGNSLAGEAFNVAPSFYPTKRRSAIKKLQEHGDSATWRIILVNEDALIKPFKPRQPTDVLHFAIDVVTGTGRKFLYDSSS